MSGWTPDQIADVRRRELEDVVLDAEYTAHILQHRRLDIATQLFMYTTMHNDSVKVHRFRLVYKDNGGVSAAYFDPVAYHILDSDLPELPDVEVTESYAKQFMEEYKGTSVDRTQEALDFYNPEGV